MSKFGEPVDDYGFPLFEENEFPIACLITFRTYATWFHGDEKGSVGRTATNIYGKPGITPSVPLTEDMSATRKFESTILNPEERAVASSAIQEVCEHRGYTLRALNTRTNHVHSVVSHLGKPEKIVNDFKAYATRALRRKWQRSGDERIWSRGASTRYLWKPRHVDAAIDYVLYCQEDIPFEFSDE
ncbi:MAG: transposase [Acidobacteria bacterium]|nr:transposase [Acidobacteriota bacterium]